MKTFITILLSLCLPMAVLAQTTAYTHVSTAAALAAQSVGSTNRTATTDGATNVYDLFGMLYTYCPTCVDATNANDLSVIMPASGVGRWKAAIKPPPTGWGTADGGGNVYNVTVPTAGAVTYFPTTNPTNALPANGAGTDGFFWDQSNKNVGIRTDSPRSPLEINQSTALTPSASNSYAITISRGVTNAVSIGSDDLASYIQSWGSRQLRINTVGSQSTIFNLSGGGVGVGTTNLLSVFHIDSASAGLPTMTYSANGAAINRIGRASADFVGAGALDFGFKFTHKLWIGGTSSAGLVMETSGNVGIGDTTPAELLTVGSGDLFRVNSNGNLIRVNNVAYSWPATNALAGQVLQSDASGNLSWTNGVSSVTSVVSTKTLTDNVATDVFTVALAALARSGLVVDFEIDVTNGTDTQTFTDTRRVSAVNKAGTVTSALSASSSATATSSADTLNVTVAITSTATTYTFTVTADTSLGTPTITLRYNILNFNGSTITPL